SGGTFLRSQPSTPSKRRARTRSRSLGNSPQAHTTTNASIERVRDLRTIIVEVNPCNISSSFAKLMSDDRTIVPRGNQKVEPSNVRDLHRFQVSGPTTSSESGEPITLRAVLI